MTNTPHPALPSALDPDVVAIAELAQEEARRRGQTFVDGRHLAYGLTRHPAGQAAVRRAGIDPLWWRDHIAFVEGVNAKDCRHGGGISPWKPLPDDATVTWHPRALAILRVSIEEAQTAGRERAGPADLLTALRLENALEPAGTLHKVAPAPRQPGTSAMTITLAQVGLSGTPNGPLRLAEPPRASARPHASTRSMVWR